MALSSTVFTFDIDLANADRGLYEGLSLRVARHPSEADEFLVARVLAYCAEYTAGIEFSRGLCDASEPPIAVRDLTGAIRVWIDIGTPSAERLHRASKLSRRVVVYVHKEAGQWLAGLRSEKIHRADTLEIRNFERAMIAAIVSRLERRMSFALSLSDGEMFVAFSDATVTGRISELTI